LSTSGGEALAEVTWRKLGFAAQQLSASVRVAAQTVKQLVDGGDGNLLGFTSFYGPLFTSRGAQEASFTVLGTTLRSNYDALYLPERRRWYVAGYPAALLEYDPRAPWTLQPGRNPSEPHVNPRQPAPGMGKYHHYLARGADGLVYVGIHHERHAKGGGLGWLDPTTGRTGQLRTPFEHFDVRDLKPALDGRKLVYSSMSLATPGGHRPDARLFVFDVASKRIEREIVPLPGSGELDKVIETSPGIVVGVAASVVYAVDIRDGRVLYRKDLGSRFGTTSPSDRRLMLGPDGHVWLVVVPQRLGSLPHLARIAPSNGALQLLQEVERLVNFLLVRNPAGTGYDAVLYGAEELRRVVDVLRIERPRQ
jgi:hypothetical protein